LGELKKQFYQGRELLPRNTVDTPVAESEGFLVH